MGEGLGRVEEGETAWDVMYERINVKKVLLGEHQAK